MGKLSLLARFAVVSAVLFLILGAVLSFMARQSIRDGALRQARDSAQLITGLAVQPALDGQDLAGGLSSTALDELDRILATALAEHAVMHLTVFDATGRIVYADQRALIGVLLGPSGELSSALQGTVASGVVADATTGQEALEVYLPMRTQPGGPVVGALQVSLDYAPIRAAANRAAALFAVAILAALGVLYALLFRTVAKASASMREQAERSQVHAEEKRVLSQRDGLTGLANRELFYARARQALVASDARGGGMVVMLLDLDRFREINESLGHHYGDLLLSEIGQRLDDLVGEADTVARLGGDEFGVLLAHARTPCEIEQTAKRLLDAVAQPCSVQDFTLAVEASVGIALHPQHGRDVGELLQRADAATHAAKEQSKGWTYYDPDKDRSSPEQIALLGELRRAIDHDELELHFQPKLDVVQRRVTGLEALIRWRHPSRGLLSPAVFVPAAEQTGLVKPLTLWVLDNALRQCRAWQDADLNLTVAVNVSARNLLDADFATDVADAIERWNVPPERLTLELTESSVMIDPHRAEFLLRQLHGLGIRLAIDDFGTGYSSLAYLQRLPVSELKIDRSFVAALTSNDDSAVIVRSTVEMGRSLGLYVVAEGVEDAATVRALADLGCHAAQGFFVGRPAPAEESLEKLLHMSRAGAR